MVQAEFEDYSNRIKLNDWDGLYAECLKLKRENMEMHVRDEEYKRSEPALAREYNRLKKENETLRKERDQYKSDYKKVCEQNIILINNRFSKHNEKTSTIKGVFSEDIEDPLSEDAAEPDKKDTSVSESKDSEKVVPFRKERGSKAGMVIHSLVETARRNRANPELYLQYVLENALDYKEVTDRKKLDELMPWSEKFKAWQHGKLMDNKAFSLNSDEKPYYRSSKAEQPHDESQAAG